MTTHHRLLPLLAGAIVGTCAGLGVLVAWSWIGTRR